MKEKILSASEIKDVIDKRGKMNKKLGHWVNYTEDYIILDLLIGDYLQNKELGNEDAKP